MHSRSTYNNGTQLRKTLYMLPILTGRQTCFSYVVSNTCIIVYH